MKRGFVTTLILLAISFTQGFAQTGTIKGKITDKKTGEELVGAAVIIEGTTTGTITNFMGEFEMPPLAPGTYSIRCQYISYEPQVKQNVVVSADHNVEINFQLGTAEMDLEEVVVVAKANRESEKTLMLEQKKSVIAMESIGAEQLSAQGVGDAASAVTKISGITKQEGSQSLNVRGLGDRYNTTTYNGLPLPTNDPDYKNIDLGLFGTDVISHINIEKTYSANLNGDFGGANINVISKHLTGEDFLTISVEGSQNSSLFGVDEFYLNDGPDKSGFYSQPLVDIAGLEDKTQPKYGFENSWNPVTSSPTPNVGIGISGGKKFDINSTSSLNIFATASFDNEQSYSERVDNIQSGNEVPRTKTAGEAYKYETQSTAMINLNYARPNSNIYFNNLAMNSSSQEFLSMFGLIRDVSSNDDGLKRRADFSRNFITVNQLLGTHNISDTYTIDWGATINNVWNETPERIQNTFLEYNPQTNIGELDPEAVAKNFRYTQSFQETEIAANAKISKQLGEGFGEDGYRSKITLGFSGSSKTRTFENYQFNHQIFTDDRIFVDANNIDAFFNQENYAAGVFKVLAATAPDKYGERSPGQDYTGNVLQANIFGLFEFNISEKLSMLAGIRQEFINQDITTRTKQTNFAETVDFTQNKPLPSLSFKYTANEKVNIRLAGSETYTIPQLQEMPLIGFQGLNDVIYGNPYLKPSKIYNGDLKFEYYPKSGEIFSVCAFAKHIDNPINKITLNGTFSEYTNANTGDAAYVYGVEFEGKKDIINFGSSSDVRKIYIATNITLMKSQTDLDAEKISLETESHFNTQFNENTSDLQGAAPLLANLTLGYKQKWDNNKKSITPTIIYNYISDRLYSIGHSAMGDQIDEAVSTLDFVIKTKINRLGIDFSAKNLLDPEYNRIQRNEDDDYLIRQRKKGVMFKLKFKYNF